MSPDREPSDRSAPRTPWLPLVASAIVVPTVLAGFTLLWPRTQVQDTLTDRAGAALSAAGISGATVSFDGRDATISGVSAAEAAQAVQAVEGATGVRVAQVAGAGGAAAAAPTSTSAATSEAAPTSTAAATSAATSAAAPSSTPAVTSTPTPAPAPAGGELDAAAKQALQAKITALTNAAPITFGGDSPQLTPQGQATLAKILPLVLGAPGARLEVDGFVATGRGNGQLTAQQLSDQRAATVRDALVAGGVPADHLTVRGRGEDTASADRARGRRADITVV